MLRFPCAIVCLFALCVWPCLCPRPVVSGFVIDVVFVVVVVLSVPPPAFLFCYYGGGDDGVRGDGGAVGGCWWDW